LPVENLAVLALHRDGSLSARENISGRLARGERRLADLACYFQIGGLRACWCFDNLIQSQAAFAAEKGNCVWIGHVAAGVRDVVPCAIIVAARA
jgi:hypothetical protein